MSTKVYYHATDLDSSMNIIKDGKIKLSMDGVVYVTETQEDCQKFLLIRGVKDILVLEVELDCDKVVETFDHSERFFKCKCYGYTEDIPVDRVLSMTRVNYDTNWHENTSLATEYEEEVM